MRSIHIRCTRGILAPALVAWCLTTAAGAQVGSIGTGGIKGFVHDSLGYAIVGAELVLPGTPRRFETDDNGKFEFAKVAAGPLSIVIRRLGFRPDTIDLMVVAGQTVPLEIPLHRAAVVLAPVVVHGREALTGWRAGFYERMTKGAGHFFTREEIEKRNPSMMTDLFRTIPGARIMSGPGGFTHLIRFRNNKAAPLVWLDGAPLAAGEFDLDALSPRSIEAMEVYAGPASVPLQYQADRSNYLQGGVILIWSREGELKPRTRKVKVSAASQIAKLVESKSVFTEMDVDVPAHQDSLHILHPGYPAGLYDAGVGGSVLAEFVVDAGGAVDLDTFSVVFATNPQFTDAVQRALRDAVYVPAFKKGYPVMQVVQHEFKFVPDPALARKR